MTNTFKPARNWTRIALLASLTLNLAVAGIVVGSAFGGGPTGGARFDLSVGPLTRALDDTSRAAIRAALRDSGAFARSDRAGMREDMTKLVALLRADTFDPATFDQVLNRQRARFETGQAAILVALTREITGMNAVQRTAFADRLEDQLRRGPPPRGN